MKDASFSEGASSPKFHVTTERTRDFLSNSLVSSSVSDMAAACSFMPPPGISVACADSS